MENKINLIYGNFFTTYNNVITLYSPINFSFKGFSIIGDTPKPFTQSFKKFSHINLWIQTLIKFVGVLQIGSHNTSYENKGDEE
jgi:hypothetical protein